MPNWAIYDTNTNAIKRYLPSDPHDPTYPVEPNEGALKDPSLADVAGQPLRYWKHVSGAIQLMTQAERDAVDAAIASADQAAAKLSAKSNIDGNVGYDKRALASIMVNEINSLREWIVSFKAAAAAATSLADLQTRVATLPDMPDRTLAQAKAAYKSLLDGIALD